MAVPAAAGYPSAKGGFRVTPSSMVSSKLGVQEMTAIERSGIIADAVIGPSSRTGGSWPWLMENAPVERVCTATVVLLDST
eukprot:2805680-Rhodomonas_salina.1